MVLVMIMAKKYKLYLENTDGDIVIIGESNSIKDIDSYTFEYVGDDDLIWDIAGNAMIEHRVNLESNYRGKVKYLPILYNSDNLDGERIRNLYLEFLKENRYLIKNSFIKYVNIGVDVNRYMSDIDLARCVYAYFNNYPYKVVRDVYFYLVANGKIVREVNYEIINRKFSYKYVSDSDDEYLSQLISLNDYDRIYRYYDLDDLSSSDMEYLSGKMRVRCK